MSRALQPEGRVVDRAFLTEQCAAVEEGIAGIEALRSIIDDVMKRLNALREGHPNADRRKRRPIAKS